MAALSILLAAGFAAAQGRGPVVQPGHEVRYYDVSGASLEELERSLEANAQTGRNGVKSYGLTEWQVGWNYVPWKRRTDCKLLYIETALRTVVTLPRWDGAADAPEPLAAFWRAYVSAVEEHEQVHVDHARAAERAVADALAKVEPAFSCGAAVREAERAALAVLSEYRMLDRKYDRDTRYGREQIEAALAEY